MGAQRAHQLSWLYQTGLVAILWTSLWSLSMLMTAAPYDSIWFPPAGITVVALLLTGIRAVPGITIAIVLTTFFNDFLFATNASVATLLKGGGSFLVTHITVFWFYSLAFKKCVRSIITRDIEGNKNNSPLILVAVFIVIALASSFTNAWIGLEALIQTGLLDIDQKQALFWSWGIGDAAGLLVVAPIGFGLAAFLSPRVRKSLMGMSFQDHPVDKGPILMKTTITLITLLIVLGGSTLSDSPAVAALILLTLIPLFWIVLTESPGTAAATLVGLTFLTALFVDSVGLVDNELIYQSALIIMAITTWLIIAIRTGVMRANSLTKEPFV